MSDMDNMELEDTRTNVVEQSHVKPVMKVTKTPYNFVPLINLIVLVIIGISLISIIGLLVVLLINNVNSAQYSLDSLSRLINVNNDLNITKESQKESMDQLKDIREELGIPMFKSDESSHMPKLVVQITIDMMRGEVLQRFKKNLLPNGFKRLLNEGMSYRNAQHKHHSTYTGIGHAVIFTGASPSINGIIGNDWLHKGEEMYCVYGEDEFGRPLKETRTREDLTHGSSPRNVLSTTIADEIILAFPNSKAFSISSKDRSAIIGAGRLGKAFWYNYYARPFSSWGDMISSTYYYNDTYPQYVNDFNLVDRYVDTFKNTQWNLEMPEDLYYNRMNDRTHVYPIHTSSDFPHTYINHPSYFYPFVYVGPAGDSVVQEFVKEVIENEELGMDRGRTGDFGPDYLSISYSSLDLIGHYYGPESLEYEDCIYKLDKHIAELLGILDNQIGLDDVLIVFTADHGSDFNFKTMKDMGFEGGAIDFEGSEIFNYTSEVDGKFYFNIYEELNENVKTEFAISYDLIKDGHFFAPYIYFDINTIAANNDINEIPNFEKFVANWMLQKSSILYTFTRTDLLSGATIQEAAQETFHSTRSGNVMLVQAPGYWLASDGLSSGTYSMHGSMYTYDRHVPLIWMGKDIRKGYTVDRNVSPQQSAATISTYLGIPRPTGSIGEILTEVMLNHKVNMN